MLRAYLAGLKDMEGDPVFAVTARDRAPLGSPDPVLAALDTSDYEALWLFAVDSGDNLQQRIARAFPPSASAAAA